MLRVMGSCQLFDCLSVSWKGLGSTSLVYRLKNGFFFCTSWTLGMLESTALSFFTSKLLKRIVSCYSPTVRSESPGGLLKATEFLVKTPTEFLIKSRWYPRICIFNKCLANVDYVILRIFWTSHLHRIFLLHLSLIFQLLQFGFNFILLSRVLFLTSFLILMLPNQIHNFQFLILPDM